MSGGPPCSGCTANEEPEQTRWRHRREFTSVIDGGRVRESCLTGETSCRVQALYRNNRPRIPSAHSGRSWRSCRVDEVRRRDDVSGTERSEDLHALASTYLFLSPLEDVRNAEADAFSVNMLKDLCDLKCLDRTSCTCTDPGLPASTYKKINV